MAEDCNSKYKDSEKCAEPMENDVMENGEEDEMNFSDPEDYVDDITDEELLGDLINQKPSETDGIDSIIVVDGIPQIGTDRLEKLQSIIRKIFTKFGKILKEYYPMENDKTKGYAFLEYSSPANAQEAVKMTYGHKLDKQHTFLVNLLSDFDKYLSIPIDWTPPESQPYKDPGNLYYWLLDADCYDQYSVIHGEQCTSIWQNSLPEPTVVEDRKMWTETYVRWSPLGTYLATFHGPGIALWGGETFTQIMKFGHSSVHMIDFSPCENYMVTLSSPVESKEERKNLIIWDIRTGIKKRGFFCEVLPVWPYFRWSCDDKYFARLATDGTLSIYETPSFGLHEKKSLKISGLRDFSWSPTDNIIAYWVAEDKDVPARVTLLEIPSRIELRAKNLFNVAECRMHWQKSGDYLCVKVDRYSKVKKEKNESKYSGMYYNFEIFHMREKQIPVDSVEIKENIIAFAWEPVGSKCCIVHGDNPNICVSFYGVKTGGTVSLLKKFEKKQCNHLFWSPHGQFIVLAGLRSMSGVMEFIDTGDMTVMNLADHFMATDLEWDPTGRYVVTGVSWWSHKVDNGYWLWSFQGKLLQRRPLEKFCQLLWRPRPPSLLQADQIKEIRKTLKKYAGQFDTKDKMSLSKASKELIEKRRKLLKDFEEYRKKRMDDFADQKASRLELRNNIDTDQLDSYSKNLDEEIVEFLIKEETTVIDEE